MLRIDKNIIDRIKEISASLGVKRLYIFGSAVSDRFNDGSDIDILIAFDETLTPGQYANNFFELHYKLQELFGRDVDIITERSLSNPYFIKSVDETKKLLVQS